MKKGLIILSALVSYLISDAQMYGAQWVLSNNTSVMDFRNDTVRLGLIPGNMGMFLTDANICDTSGDLLYFTNGCYIADRNGNLLENGDSLNPCLFTNEQYAGGLGIGQAALFLPMPSNLRYYYLFSFSNDSADNLRPGTLFYSMIDAEANSGLGALIQKNNVAFHGILREGGMTACKHANGRDYWIILPAAENGYYKLLLTPDTILGPYLQYIGPSYTINQDLAYSKFTLDGSKYVTACGEGLVAVMDFDRCSGEFSNVETIFNYGGTISNQPISSAASEEFSPNGRFLYVCDVLNLNQYDLWSGNHQDSVNIWTDSTTDFWEMDFLQLAPNGKIYGCTYNGGLDSIHVVNYPDLKGDSCSFVFEGQHTMTGNSNVLPNMINYNLGALVGSGCDTIRAGITQVNKNDLLRVMPNPADKYLYVEMGMQGNYEFDLVNESGQVIAKRETRQVDNFDTERLADGVYFVRVIDKVTNVEIIAKK